MTSTRSGADLDLRRRRLFRFASFVVLWIVLLIFFGGQVKSTDSGLSVPDWPNTYNHFMFTFPYEKWVGGIFWEHSHRLLASLAGLWTVVLTIWTLVVEKERRWVRNLAWGASLMVVVQGVLGGLTVLYGLPAWISSSHGTLAQIYLCTVLLLALALSPRWNEVSRFGTDEGGRLRRLTTWTFGVIFVQLIFGAVMRHNEAGLAIPDFPLMYGGLAIPLSDQALAFANNELVKLHLPAIDRWDMITHLAHRFWAFVVSGMVIWASMAVRRRHPGNRILSRPALALYWLLGLQVTLGILILLTNRHFVITSLHVVTGAVTLATSFALMVRARHYLAPARESVREIEPVEEIPVADEVMV